ncbi:hypothetical protein ACFR97_16315 [Haloplanus litoreus]|uniref:Holin of 3TMs, for gene-transfer release n=1 Tax=Haloplanus litoreus TaxID=767515 RepID=A0ABD6A3Q9_9EURY
MVTGLYASLAASASVFIGILTALLASNISTHKAERNRITYRIQAIDARLRELDDKRGELEDVIEDIYLTWIDEQRTEEDHEDTDWYIHEREEYNRNQQEWLRTKTEIRSLQREREKLNNRYDTLDPSRIRETLEAGVIAIFLAVVIPSIAYLAHVVDFPGIETSFWWIEPVIIFVLWAVGLGYVFQHLRDKLDKEPGNLPEEPEIEFTELDEPDELPDQAKV